MKSLHLLLIAVLLITISACKKNETTPEIIIEPRPTMLISEDSIFTGEKWGMAIGEPAENSYLGIRRLKFQTPVSHINASSIVFTNLEGLENKIPLYTSLFLAEGKVASKTIQISFENEKVKSIWTADGKKLPWWPLNAAKSRAIIPGDAINSIYTKLSKLNETPSVSSQMRYISLTGKDTAKPYDPDMSLLPLWSFYAKVDDTFFYLVNLKLKDGKLNSIHSALYKLL